MIKNIMQFLADNIDEVEYMEDGTGGNIFDNVLPAEPDTALMIESTGGASRDMRLMTYMEPSIRILVRGTEDPRPARWLAEDVIDVMGVLVNQDWDNWRVVKSQATQGHPVNIGRDGKNRHRFSCNFELEVQRKE